MASSLQLSRPNPDEHAAGGEEPRAPSSAAPWLHLAGVTVRYGPKVVIDRVSMGIGKGEFLTVLGNSGCGKTTLLQAVAGFVSLADGSIRVGGQEIGHLPPHRRHIGIVHQQYALFPHLTVFENVAFGLRVRKLPRAVLGGRVASYLNLVHMEEYADYLPGQLSGGMQQRVALARALALEPQLLLLDEPLSALDTNLRIELRNEIKQLHRQLAGLTVVYVTHDREEAMLLSDRIALLGEGRVVQLGTPAELYDRPVSEFVASYLGDVNFLPLELVEREILKSRLVHLPQPGAPRAPRVFIRPERVRLDESGALRYPGTVAHHEWTGSTCRIRIAVQARPPFTVTAQYPRREEPLVPGSPVQISFMPEECVLVDH